MENEEQKIDIPEELQEICRDFGKIAQKHGLYRLNGTFRPRSKWGGDINFIWEAGRHNEDSNEIRISSTFNVFTKITDNKYPK